MLIFASYPNTNLLEERWIGQRVETIPEGPQIDRQTRKEIMDPKNLKGMTCLTKLC